MLWDKGRNIFTLLNCLENNISREDIAQSLTNDCQCADTRYHSLLREVASIYWMVLKQLNLNLIATIGVLYIVNLIKITL